MAIKFGWGIIADKANFDASGKLSILGEFQIINVPNVPTSLPSCTLIARWFSDLENPPANNVVEMELQIIMPNGEPIGPPSAKFAVKFGGTNPELPLPPSGTLAIELGGVPLPEFGLYRIQFFAEGAKVGEIPFGVKQLAPKSE